MPTFEAWSLTPPLYRMPQSVILHPKELKGVKSKFTMLVEGLNPTTYPLITILTNQTLIGLL